MTEKRGRGRPKGAPNKPLMKLITERKELLGDADVYEILCQANIVAEESPDLAVQGLQVFNDRNGAIKPVLQWAFDVNINSTLPEGKTPYGQNDAPATDLTETSLRFEHKLFKYFVTEQIPVVKREHMWIGLLEGIPKEEAELIDLVKDGKWPFKNITKEIAKTAFSEINI
tara:strand:- start:1016 stop:1528 length:513 start_codon:yes stop_codon:yes gene_type:complete